MKFYISSTCVDSYDFKEILEKYPCLKEFGFKTERFHKPHKKYIRDEKGKLIEFVDEKFYHNYEKAYIEINSLEDILKLKKETAAPIIISEEEDGYEIEIYDGYRE